MSPGAAGRQRRSVAVALPACALLAAPLPARLPAQQVDSATYARADRIRTFDPSLVGGRVTPVWLPDSVRFYYVATGPGADRGTIYLVDPRARTRRPLLDGRRVAAALSVGADTTIDPRALPAGKLVDEARAMQFDLRGQSSRCSLDASVCVPVDSARVARDPRGGGPAWASRSPDGAWDAFVWDYNVYVRPARLTNAEPAAWRPRPRPATRLGCDAAAVAGPVPPPDSVPLPAGSVALTTDGAPTWGYGVYHFGLEVAQLAADRYRLTPGGLRWSPDSKRLVASRDDLRGVRIYPLYSSTSNQPVDHSYFYAVPGDSAVPRYGFAVLDVARRAAVPVREPPIGLLGSPGGARWGRTSDELYVLGSTRGSKAVRIALVDAATGVSRPVVQDSSATFLDFDASSWAVVNGGEDVLWVSERDGWAHLYRSGRDGTLKNQVTRGQYAVSGITRVDSVRKQVYFTATGKAAGVPYYAHLYRVDFDGGNLTELTPEAGDHAVTFVPKAPYFLDVMQAIDRPPVTVLRANDGRVVMALERGDVTALRATGWTPAEVFTVKARDDSTDLWGILHRPSDFDPSRKYPVITHVYPGPQIGSVREWAFKGPDSRDGTGPPYVSDLGSTRPRTFSMDGKGRALAELGFVVLQLDALGTNKRSKAFHDVFYGRVRDNGLPDQIAAIRQLAARYPWIDTTRVGVFGHSGGGYSAAAALLHFPDVFKVGVAQSGNHDFRVYGWYWGEKYQGLYQTAGAGDNRVGDNKASDNYEAEANYKYAANLKGKLLLMSGDMDCNNPPAETLRLVDALIKAERPFDMLLVPDAGHQLPTYATRRAWDYFVRHLLGTEPPDGYRMHAP